MTSNEEHVKRQIENSRWLSFMPVGRAKILEGEEEETISVCHFFLDSSFFFVHFFFFNFSCFSFFLFLIFLIFFLFFPLSSFPLFFLPPPKKLEERIGILSKSTAVLTRLVTRLQTKVDNFLSNRNSTYQEKEREKEEVDPLAMIPSESFDSGNSAFVLF